MNAKESAQIDFWYARVRDHNSGKNEMSREDLVKAKVTVDEILMTIKAEITTAKSNAASKGEYLDPDAFGLMLAAKVSCVKLSGLLAVALMDIKKKTKPQEPISQGLAGKVNYRKFYLNAKSNLPPDVFDGLKSVSLFSPDDEGGDAS